MTAGLGAILAPFIGAAMMPALYRWLGRRLGAVAFLFGTLTLILVALTSAGQTVTISWAPQLGIDFMLAVDGLGRLLALLVSGIGSLIIFYSLFYLNEREDLGKFYLYILMFMGAMLGVVYSGNLMNLYIFWELTSISSFLLIGFWHTTGPGKYGALKSLLITVGGGLTMLGGIAILGYVGGTYELAGLLAANNAILSHPLGGVALGLILIGALSKSAQVPFYIWLPDAMSAPTPVSAYLHSATMVKAGLFFVARLWPLFNTHPLWTPLVTTVGLVTMVLGAYLALQQTDLKALLAMSTVSQLGLMMALYGYGTEAAAAAAVFHLLNHAIFKGLLFLVVGIVDHQTGTRDIRQLSGLRRFMPVSAALAAVGAAAMAGVPLTNGFLSKEMFLEASLHAPYGLIVPVIAAGSSILTTAYCLMLVHRVFFGAKPAELPQPPREASWPMLAAPVILAALVVAIGVAPALVEQSVVEPAVAAVLQHRPEMHIAIWHGLTPALGLSVLALAGGVLVYVGWPRLAPLAKSLRSHRFHLNTLYNWLWWDGKAIERAAGSLTRMQMTGLLRDYLVFVFGAAAFSVLTVVLYYGLGSWQLDLAPVALHEWAPLLVVVAGAIVVTRVQARLAAVAAVSMIGLPLSAWFALMRAPDLALTQVVVEVVTGALMLLVFAHLPQLRRYPDKRPTVKVVNVIVSLAVGAMATIVTLLGNGVRLFPSAVKDWMLEHAASLGGGTNVVNVTLVDFRGFDTMFEIVVMAVGGLAIYMLVRLRQPREAKGAEEQ